MLERNIFIGLGGSGVNTVANLKYKIYANLDKEHAYEILNENYKFLFIDTDQADVNKLNNYFKSKFEEGKKELIDPINELINLGTINPSGVYREAFQKKPTNRTDIDNTILETCNEDFSSKLKAYPLSDGAGAFRYNSHIAFAHQAKNFVNRLQSIIRQLVNTQTAGAESVALRYWVVSSSNGGTGSGIFNDVLYLVNMYHKMLRPNEEPKTTLVLYMPRSYVDANAGDSKYLCNAQAVFLEMDGYQCMSYSGNDQMHTKAHQMLFRPDNLQIKKDKAVYHPFTSCIPIDIQTENGNSLMSTQAMYSNTAELLYFIHQSQGRNPLASSFKSDADNHLDDIIKETPLNYLQPMGYVALRKPEAEFESYIEHRLKTEILSYGLLCPFPDELNLENEIYNLYQSHIYKPIFSSEPDSFSAVADQIVKGCIKRSFSDNLLKEDGKPRKRLPSGISQAAADKIVSNFTLTLNNQFNGRTSTGNNPINSWSRNTILKQIEESLWTWVEDYTLKYGLEYVKTVLDGLDNYATEQLTDYMTGIGTESASSLSENIKRITEQLPDLRHKAEEITISERLWESNADDIRNYYNQLLAYIQAKGNQLLAGKKYELLSALCKGDNGIIDNIRFYIGELCKAVSELAEKPRMAYRELARHFDNASLDITTVYLPDISKFVKNGAWDTDNKFSKLYEQILLPNKRLFIPGHGFAPMRTSTQSREHSVEAFLRKTIECNKETMSTDGYYVENQENSHSTLFRRNRWSENPYKVIDDLLSYISETYRKEYRSDLDTEWYALSLGDLFERLTEDERKSIRTRLYPQLFYSYRNSVIDSGREFKYIIAPTKEMAKSIFNYQEGSNEWRYDQSSSTTVAYMLKAKIGLPISSYALYDIIKQEYDKQEEKTSYHTHVAWSECNGDYRKLDIRQETEKELIVFAKYLILNEYSCLIPDLFYTPKLEAEKEFYAQSPCIILSDSMVFASEKAVDIVEDYVALHYEKNCFDEYVSESPDLLYSSVYKKFKESYIANRHKAAIYTLLNNLAEISEVRHTYNHVKEKLIEKLNQLYISSKRTSEKDCLRSIIHLFDTDNILSDYAKFTE